MELKDIQNFLNNHTGEQYFEKDMELYIQKFPSSRIIPDLKNVQKYNKAQLDERMCYELLSDGGQCIDCIWEQRGFTRDNNGFIVPMVKEGELSEPEKELLAIDLGVDHKYNVLKALIFGLQIPTSDNKQATYLEALKIKKEELIAAGKSLTPEQNQEEIDAIAKAESIVDSKPDDMKTAQATDEAKVRDVATAQVIDEAKASDVAATQVIDEAKASDVATAQVIDEAKPSDVATAQVIDEAKASDVAATQVTDEAKASDVATAQVSEEKKSEDLDQNTQASTGQI